MPSSHSSSRVACLGESMLMLVPVERESLAEAERFERAVGGAESNVAMGLARLNVSSSWLSRVGDDAFGEYLLRYVADAGVDVSHVQVDPSRPTGVYFKDFQGGGHTHVRYYRGGSAASAMSAQWFDPAWLEGAELLHLTGITPALSPPCYELIAMLMERKPRGFRISLDVNWRPSLWNGLDTAALTHFARLADIVLVGDDEAAALWGTGDPARIREHLPEPPEVVVKHGARGATLLDAAGAHFEPALSFDGEPVDRVGAGDAFAAGFLAGQLEGRDPRACLRLGHVMGAAALATGADVPAHVGQEEINRLVALADDEWKEARWSPDRSTLSTALKP